MTPKDRAIASKGWSGSGLSGKLGAMTRISLFLALMLLPGAAAAQMSAAEFEAYVTGRTLTYADRGVIYGIEEYLPNRRVRWAFMGDQCRDGFWYEADGQICFVYENKPDAPQCWQFTERAGRLSALFMGAEDGRELYEAQNSDEPLVCLGPDVGA